MKGELWKAEDFANHSQHIFNGNLHLPANARLGINGKVHYSNVSPENYVPPHLHVSMGLVNDFINYLFYFIDACLTRREGRFAESTAS
jgi:hypothetical protein